MDFTLTSDQEALQEAVRKLCEGRFPMERVRALAEVGGVDRGLWRELADAGVFSLRLPEDDGGAGLGMAEAALVFEELGRALVPGPLVWTHLAAGVIAGAAEGERVVGGLPRQEEPFLVEYPEAIDVLLALDDDGLWEVDRSRLSASPVSWPLDPLTPVHVAGGLLRGERRGVPGDAVRWQLVGAVLTQLSDRLLQLLLVGRQREVHYLGSPRMRSPMMLRWIWLVPAATVRARTRSRSST